MQCSNKLKQLGLALHNYHASQNSFPPALGGPAVVNSGGALVARRSMLIPLFAYMEQGMMYADAYAPDATAPNLIDLATGRGLIWAKDIPAFLCPSDSGPGKSETDPGVAGSTNYAMCTGDWSEAGLPSNAANRFHNPRGFASATQLAQGTPGITRNMGSVYDGTSNTIALGEFIIYADYEGSRAKAGIIIDSTAAVTGNKANVIANTNPGACFANVVGGQYTGSGTVIGRKGQLWCQGLPMRTSFSTLLPPNGPSCSSGSDNNSARTISSAASNHTGGVNVVLVDGSVQFVSDSVDTGRLTDAANPARLRDSGPTEFGVWGAYGSIDGGEVAAL
jgi:prepilin-type processing-associated H-X9-DG protein